MKGPKPSKRKLEKTPDRFENERKVVEQQKAGLEELFRRQVKRGVIV